MTRLSIFGPELKDFDKFFVGFDHEVNRLLKLHADVTKHIPNYPPYNIRKTGENTFTIELAIAGFAQSEIDIELDGGKLIVSGNVKEPETDDYLFKGIANRAFTRAFAIGDQIEVKNAEFFNGMLKIILERLIPEQQKPKKVTINVKGSKQFLTEDEKDAIASRL